MHHTNTENNKFSTKLTWSVDATNSLPKQEYLCTLHSVTAHNSPRQRCYSKSLVWGMEQCMCRGGLLPFLFPVYLSEAIKSLVRHWTLARVNVPISSEACSGRAGENVKGVPVKRGRGGLSAVLVGNWGSAMFSATLCDPSVHIPEGFLSLDPAGLPCRCFGLSWIWSKGLPGRIVQSQRVLDLLFVSVFFHRMAHCQHLRILPQRKHNGSTCSCPLTF